MRRTWNVPACFLAGLILIAAAADAAVKPGICTVQITMTFSPSVKVGTTEVSVGLAGGGDLCGPVPSTSPLTTMNLTSASGEGLVAACSGIVVVGTSYGMTFGQHYGPSNGAWLYVGTVAGGTLAFIDTDLPALVGVAELVLDPLESSNADEIEGCATGGGMTELRFLGALSFVGT